MDSFVRSRLIFQDSALDLRPARRFPRRGRPLRWAATSRRPPPGKPSGGGGSGRPPRSAPPPLSREDADWLESLRPWALKLVQRAGGLSADAEDVVQQAFAQAAARWDTFGAVPDLPERTARRRWLQVVLFRTAELVRDARARDLESPLGAAVEPAPVESQESAASTRQLLARLQASTTPERWRAWLLHEVDEVPIAEIARQEGRPAATIYNRLRLAREDFKSAFARDAAAVKAPRGVRPAPRRRT
jgi:RNA polymerase sigma-70 factor (ECF subfamily)